MTKNELRESYKTLRDQIPNKKQRSGSLMEKVVSSQRYQDAKVVAFFASLPMEVNTDELIQKAFLDHKTIAFPKVEGGNLSFYTVNSLNELHADGPFGIREPLAQSQTLIPKEAMDLILVPGICFDVKNHRIGYGKGFFDRYLKGCPAYKMGICFKEQIYNGEIPISENDVAVDEVIHV